MNKALDVLKRELQHVEYLLDSETGWTITEVVSRNPGNREARIALKENVNDPNLWNEAFWSFEDLDDKIQVGMIVSGVWWDDGSFRIEEAYTPAELEQLKNDLLAAINDLEAPRFIEVRTTGGQVLSPVIVRNLKEAVLAIHDEMDARYNPGWDSASIYGEHGDLAYQYTPGQELSKHGLAEYISASGRVVITQKDAGEVVYSHMEGPLTKIFPLS